MRTKSYESVLLEELRDPDVAAEYLTAAVELRSVSALRDGLKHILEAHGGIAPISEISGIHQKEITSLLSPETPIPIQTLSKLLNAVGINITFSSLDRK